MSSGSSNMAGGALGTAFSLLLLASITQGIQYVELSHSETLEAEVGQNVTLPCIVRDRTDLTISNVEWRKRENGEKKLAVHAPGHGTVLFWPNVTIQVVNNANKTIGSILQLHEVDRGNSGIYICEYATFPLGNIWAETKLKIRDSVRIVCDKDSSVEVYSGENVTIHCTVLPNARYRWTKNKEVLSHNESLGLRWVTDSHAGVYTLTVNTGNETLHMEFNITIRATTTSSRSALVTVSPRFTVTEEGVKTSAGSSFSTEISATDTSVTWTMGTSVIDDNPKPNNTAITSSFTVNSTTSSPAAHTVPYNSNNSTTVSDGSTVLAGVSRTNDTKSEESSTLGTRTANPENPGAASTLSAETTTDATGDKDAVRNRGFLFIIIVPVLALIAVAGVVCRRRLIKQRMDGPPSFKPPPPPAKYTSALRHQDIYRPSFPIARCNSVTEFDMKNLFFDI